MTHRRICSMAVIALTSAALMLVAPTTDVLAAPFRTTAIAPDLAACTADQKPSRNTACAAAMTQLWLAHRGRSGVVRETVRVDNPAFGLSWNPQNRDICVYAELGKLLNLGLHHCDRITFVNPETDADLISTRTRAIATFLHESSHGVQEAAGLKPVSTTIFGPADELRRLELASDCWSGAGMAWLVTDGRLGAADLAEATAFMYALPDNATHGNGDDRGQAFTRGIAEGPAACDQILSTRVYT